MNEDAILKQYLLPLFLAALCPSLAWAYSPDEPCELVDRWAAAFNDHDPEALTALYRDDALTLNLASDGLIEGAASIHDYFLDLRKSRPSVQFGLQRSKMLSDNVALCTGFYGFTNFHARFTFVLVRQYGKWLIAHQHGSAVPKRP